MKLLSICIPTYNRPNELVDMSQGFLTQALDQFHDTIEIIICDNSDINIAKQNENKVDPRIIYCKNKTNIGFSGNLVRCVREANGIYIWIISDNDPIIWDGFVDFMTQLSYCDNDKIDCLLLPFKTKNSYGDVFICNRNSDLNLPEDCTLIEYAKIDPLPFILFSTAVIRINKIPIPALINNYPNNDYIQVILYFSMLNANSKVRFMKTCTVEYKQEYHYRFMVSSMARSLTVVRKFLAAHLGLFYDKKKDYRRWLFMLLQHRSGLSVINNADEDSWKILTMLPSEYNFKNQLLAFMLILPKSILRPIYIWYRSYVDLKSQGNLTLSELLLRIATYKKIISKSNQ
jgi:glycosyltransferase involved in cell wall biosynthesis